MDYQVVKYQSSLNYFNHAKKNVIAEQKNGKTNRLVECEKEKNMYKALYELTQIETIRMMDVFVDRCYLSLIDGFCDVYDLLDASGDVQVDTIRSNIRQAKESVIECETLMIEEAPPDVFQSQKSSRRSSGKISKRRSLSKKTKHKSLPSDALENIYDKINITKERRKSQKQQSFTDSDKRYIHINRRVSKRKSKTSGPLKKLISSEKNYVTTLGYIVNIYMPKVTEKIHLLGNNSDVKFNTIFINITALFRVSTKIWGDFEMIYRTWPENSLGIYIIKLYHILKKIYIQYHTKLEDSINELNNSNRKLKDYLNKISANESILELKELLIAPSNKLNELNSCLYEIIQQIPEDTNEYMSLREAIDRISQLTFEIEESVNDKLNIEKVNSIRNGLEWGVLNHLESRLDRYVHSGPLLLLQITNIPERISPIPDISTDYVYLFSNLILLVYKQEVVGYISLPTFSLSESEDDHVIFADDKFQYKFKCELDDKHEWEEITSNTIDVLNNDKKVFGVALDIVANRNNSDIPAILETCCTWIEKYALNKQGIFRESGELTRLLEIRDEFDFGNGFQFDEEESPNNVAGVLKMWFRAMPQPLLSYELYDEWIDIYHIADNDERNDSIIKLLDILPMENKFVLEYLIRTLCKCAQLSEVNLMSPTNLAIVFAPNLLKKKASTDVTTLGLMDVGESAKTVEIIEHLITYYDVIFDNIIIELESRFENRIQKERDEAEAAIQRKEFVREALLDVTDSVFTRGLSEDKLNLSETIKEGYVTLKEKKWKKVFIKLKFRHLYVYKNHKADQPKHSILLTRTTVGFSSMKQHCFCLSVVVPKTKTYFFVAAV
eukprot:TRINITY_DN2727_c0_g1_i1.p1 TRINITY_DN2727_c0_g1~~TRINITY_DN2727_c0_g1_i1.p1  ORF type:complete len:952 (-),score=201.84 TRINITY_DN2727_c0_g1_i1:274-2790(-)